MSKVTNSTTASTDDYRIGDPPTDRGPIIGIPQDDLKAFRQQIVDAETEAATLRQQLAEEREKVARVECYWDADDREIGHLDICEILENCGPGEVAEIEHVAVVATTFEAFLPAADDAETDDQFEVCEDTREAAEAKVAQELARRAALSTTEAKTDDQ